MRKLTELTPDARVIATQCVRQNLTADSGVLAETLNLRKTSVMAIKANITRKLDQAFNEQLSEK